MTNSKTRKPASRLETLLSSLSPIPQAEQDAREREWRLLKERLSSHPYYRECAKTASEGFWRALQSSQGALKTPRSDAKEPFQDLIAADQLSPEEAAYREWAAQRLRESLIWRPRLKQLDAEEGMDFWRRLQACDVDAARAAYAARSEIPAESEGGDPPTTWKSSRNWNTLILKFPEWRSQDSLCYIAGNDIKPMGGIFVRYYWHPETVVRLEALDPSGMRAQCSVSLPSDKATLESLAGFLLEIAACLTPAEGGNRPGERRPACPEVSPPQP